MKTRGQTPSLKSVARVALVFTFTQYPYQFLDLIA